MSGRGGSAWAESANDWRQVERQKRVRVSDLRALLRLFWQSKQRHHPSTAAATAAAAAAARQAEEGGDESNIQVLSKEFVRNYQNVYPQLFTKFGSISWGEVP